MHNVTTGKSIAGILKNINKTPLNWYSKKQATVETTTYGSEFVAACICMEQIIGLRSTLRYLGVPVTENKYMFGDNKSVVDSYMPNYINTTKCYPFHHVTEAIASGIVGFYFIPGELNPTDILSKHWGYTHIRQRLKSLLF
jgi:hypothetical protein